MQKGYLRLFFPRFLIIFSVLILLLSFATYYVVKSYKKEVELSTHSTINRIELILNDRVKSTRVLRSFVLSHSYDDMVEMAKEGAHIHLYEFVKIASALRVYRSTRTVQLLPDGKLSRYTYPYNEYDIEYTKNILEGSDKQSDAILAKTTGQSIISGPLKYKAGNMALIIRTPIYYPDKRFWGYSSVILDFPGVLEPLGLNTLKRVGYAYEIGFIDDNGIFTLLGTNVDNNRDIFDDSYEVQKSFYGRTWVLRTIPRNGWFSYSFVVMCSVFFFFISVLISHLLTVKKQSALALKKALILEKKLRSESIHANNELEKSNIAKTQFLTTFSHDIRTPMNAVVGLCELLLRDNANSDLVIEHTKKIQNSCDVLLTLINDNLDLKKIDSGNLSLNYQDFYLSDLISSISVIVNSQARPKHQSFEVKTYNLAHEKISSDKLRLNQILLNFLSNSVKYTKNDGHIVLKITENKGATSHDAQYTFEVEDNGIGMSEEYLKHVYEPFSRDNKKVYGIQGSGLGMAIAHKLVKLLHGTISIESKVDVGTKITCVFNFDLNKEDGIYKKYFNEHNIKSVLLIDSDKEAQDSVKTAFRNTDVIVTCMDEIEDASGLLDVKLDYDLFLVAATMSDMTAFEVCRYIRKAMGQDKYIFIFTNEDYDGMREKSKDYGVTDFIAKPFFISNLKHILDKHNNCGIDDANSTLDALKSLHILAAEDNELNAEILSELLDMHGATCHMCKNGLEIVDFCKKNDLCHFDIILMDIEMPYLNGLEATAKIRAMDKPGASSIPIIAMTGNAFVEDVEKSLASGMDFHLTKPIDMQELSRVVQRLLYKDKE